MSTSGSRRNSISDDRQRQTRPDPGPNIQIHPRKHLHKIGDKVEDRLVEYVITDTKPYGSVEDIKPDVRYRSTFLVVPPLDRAIKGDGETMFDRLNWLLDEYELNLHIEVFAERMAEYALSKYILSMLIHGEFNLKYLTRAYHNDFLKDLTESRFSAFIEIYRQPELLNYEIFFRKEVK